MRNRLTGAKTCGFQVGERKRKERESLGVGRCKLLYLEWINIKVLLWRTGNYVQSLRVNYNGKECLKNNVYTCVTESLCWIVEMDTLKINQISIKKRLGLV